MADLKQLEAAFIKADEAGNTEDAQAFANEIKRMRSAQVSAPKSETMPANAGAVNLAASVVGTPVDAVTNVLNLGIAGAGRLTGTTPDLIKAPVGSSDWIRQKARETGMAGLSPDNPTPNSKMGTAQYDFVSRGGVVPGGALPAASSMVAEKIGGPQWAGVGSMVPSALRTAAAELPRPALSPQKQLLVNEGVALTPGQIMGGGTQRLEDAATSIPILGDFIRAAQRRGHESFDVAAINRALAPIGATVPRGMPVQQAVAYARARLGDSYDRLLPNLRGDLNAPLGAGALPVQAGQAAGPTFAQELQTIRGMGANLPEPQRGQLGRIIDREVLGRFTPSGIASGETLKQIESELGRLAKDFRRSDNYDTRTLGNGVQEIQAAMRRMVESVNPQHQGQLAAINEGYANFKKVQNAAASIGAKDSVFTPAQLQRSVRSGDTSKDKRAFSEGNALMQDLSSSGRAVLSQSVPDSGTPFRGALMYGLSHPLNATIAGAPIAIGSAAYSPLGQTAIQSLLTGRVQPVNESSALQRLLQQILIENQQQ